METDAPVVEEKKALKGIGLNVLIILLVLAALGLGIWGAMLGIKLNATLESQTALQKQYEELLPQNKTMTSNLDTAKAELEKAKVDLENAKKGLASTEASLAKVKENNAKLQADVEKALMYVNVLSGIFVEKESLVENINRIDATGDSALKEKYEKVSETGRETDAAEWLEYLLKTLNELLKK